MVLSNDHSFGPNCLAIKTSPNLPLDPNITVDRSSYNGVDEYLDSAIELQVGVLCEFDVSHRHIDSPNDEFLPIDSVIDVDLIFLLSMTFQCISP